MINLGFALQIIIGMILIALSSQKAGIVQGVCTLDEMKMLAVEACEHIFQNDVRHSHQKREIPDHMHQNTTNLGSEHHRYASKIMKVNRKDYPCDGFLLVSHKYAKVLNRMDHDPEYNIVLAKKHLKYYDKMGVRGKRNSDGGIQLPYCCLNKCRMDHFCRR